MGDVHNQLPTWATDRWLNHSLGLLSAELLSEFINPLAQTGVWQPNIRGRVSSCLPASAVLHGRLGWAKEERS